MIQSNNRHFTLNTPEHIKNFLKVIIDTYHFTYQEQRELYQIANDLHMWEEENIDKIWNYELDKQYSNRQLKKAHLNHIRSYYQMLLLSPTKYQTKSNKTSTTTKPKITIENKQSLGFGLCPVASPKTRCCNLLTLDAVESCGFDCSYCSIQSFYNGNKIVFDKDLKNKLDAIKLDPNEFYHIGTGQSSDSLMWGNYNGILDHLIEFAQKNPNVMLEFKTKSDNINYFLDKTLPPNLLFTWSLNPQTIIDNEEHLTASLKRRIDSAKKMQDIGALVGFHFHPMIYYENYKKEYGEIFQTLTESFDPKNVALVSLGTLTFIKPVIKQIRQRDFKSKILQMPLTNASGKFSYPITIKKEIFSFAYQSLKEWHNEVYFYLCMEDHSLWKDVFGYEYPTNETFEQDMKLHYLKKIRR